MGDPCPARAGSEAEAQVNRPGPWSFHDHIYGLSNVVLDAESRHIASNVPRDCGPLLAAGPQLLERIARIERLVSIGSPAHTIAQGTLVEFAYWRPKLRIVGTAS